METTERKYSSKYERILRSHVSLVNYVEFIERQLEIREQRRRIRALVPQNARWQHAMENDFISVNGLGQTGSTLAIHEMAVLSTDLIFIKDLSRIRLFKERQYHHSDASFVSPHFGLYEEIRANEETLAKKFKETGFHPAVPAGIQPERIFIDDSLAFFNGCFSPKNLFRWIGSRFESNPVVIAL